MKVSITKLSIILLILIPVISTFTEFSQSIERLIFIFLIAYLYVILMFDKNHTLTPKIVLEAGFFYLYFAVALTLGIIYHYNIRYVTINLIYILPILIPLLLPTRFKFAILEKILVTTSIISSLVSIVESFYWPMIPVFKNIVNRSIELRQENHILASLVTSDGQLRAFGIFPNAFQNGTMIVMSIIFILNKRNKRFIDYMLLLVLLFSIFLTKTRNAYLITVSTIFLYFLINLNEKKSRKISNTLIKWWLYNLSIYAIVLCGVFLYIKYFISDIHDSILARIYSWITIIETYLFHSNSFKVLFGYSLTQLHNEASPQVPFWAIDNTILYVFLSSGVIGVALYFIWLYRLVKTTLISNLSYETKKTILLIISSFFIGGIMNANVVTCPIAPILLMINLYVLTNKKEGKNAI